MTKVINLKADIKSVTENKIWGYNVTKSIPMKMNLDFIWYKKNGSIPKNLIDDNKIFITHESIDEIHGVGNGKPDIELIKLLQENGRISISQDYRDQTTRYIPKYNYKHIHEDFTCPECGKKYSTSDIICDYDDDGYLYYLCPECDETLDIELIYEEISDDTVFDFILSKV